MSAVRVGLSTTMIEPAFNHGHVDGIGVYTSALMAELPGAGCEVQGYSFPQFGKTSSAQRYLAGQALPRSFEMQMMRDLLLPAAAPPDLPVDVFHATDYRIVHMDCPVVATLHDAMPLKFPEWCSPRLRGMKNWLQKKAVQKADQVIAVSNFAVTELVEHFDIDEKRITVVLNGVGADWLRQPDTDAVRRTLDRHAVTAGYFLFVGTLQPRKNIDRILDAYLGLPAALRTERQLVIVGFAGWRCETLLRKLHAAIAQGEKIVWLNRVTNPLELRHLYAGAGVFVFPSLYEGFGIPVAEAFAAGVPVVTSNTTSLPEVSQGAALEIDPLSVSAIGEAMQQLARDAQLRARCIAAGYLRAAELTWQRSAVETAAVYDCALGR